MRGKKQPLESVLNKVISRLDRKSGGGYRQARIHSTWNALAGERVASHTAGAHLREGELVVYVDSPVWAAELSALSEHYRTAMNSALGQETVKSVRFSVSRKVEEKRRVDLHEEQQETAAEKDKVPSVPLSAQERAQVEMSVASIPDEELREAVLRATVADLEWKKGQRESKSREERREGP